MTRLIHYSALPLTTVRRREPGEPCGLYKPPGLWVSVQGEDDWLNWCIANAWALDSFTHATEVHLVPDANVMVIRSVAELDDFSTHYADPADGEDPQMMAICKHGWRIDWHQVRADFDGLIIPELFWERRLTCAWYSGWDCASGVIWGPRCIDRIEAIEPPDLKREAV